MTKQASWRGLVVLVALAAGCGGDDGLGLDRAPEDDARYDELRSRLAITIGFQPSDDARDGLDPECSELIDRGKPCCNLEYCSARALAGYLRMACAADDAGTDTPIPDRRIPGPGDTCSQLLIDADIEMCVAQRLLRIIEDPGDAPIPARPLDPVELANNFTQLVVGPQDAESNTAIAREAIRRLVLVQQHAGAALNMSTAPLTGPPVPTCTVANFNATAFTDGIRTDAEATRTQVQELASFYIEAGIAADEAMIHLAEQSAAVSDSFFSTGDVLLRY